ncbi:M13 family metallopeptidase [Corynebacterium sp. Marseille-Q2516]
MNDLYSCVNGPWLASHVIPADRGVDGTFHALRDAAEADVHAIVRDDEGLPGVLFSSFMDTDAITAAGLAPLADDIAQIRAADSPDELARVLGQLDRHGVGAPVGFWVEKDSRGENSVVYLVQSGLGLPDEAYYREEAHAQTLGAYRAHVGRMLSFLVDPSYSDCLNAPLGSLSPTEAADRILDLEAQLASGHWDVVASRDAVKTYNPTPFAQLPPLVAEMLTAAGVPTEDVIVMMPSYLDHLAELFDEEHLEDFRLWAVWHVLLSRAGLLAPEITEANSDFFGRTLSGATEQRDRWKRGVSLVESMVGHEVGKAYVKEHFPASSKEAMLGLVDLLLEAYRERITALEWMTQETKARALEKLKAFRAKIGYPEHPRSYEGLTFSPGGQNLVANVAAAAAFRNDDDLSKVGKPVDRDEWFATPQTVNAFYNPVVNDITFPAAILQPPFFDPEADMAENLGAIGAVIGHEIGHGFDDQGSQYDGQGNLDNWWTDADREAFSALTENLVTQFDGRVPTVLAETGMESRGVNGRFTLGENIGDLGGLGIAVAAYRNYLAAQGQTFADTPARPFPVDGGEPVLAQQDFTGLQRLFLAWARVWRTAIRPEMATQYLAIDPHSPAEFRCNIIAGNVAELYEAFPEIGPDSAMYIAPEDRVTIW